MSVRRARHTLYPLDFDAIQKSVFEKIAQLGELLDVSDAIAKGGKPQHGGQMSALKLSIDSRIRLLTLWKPAETNLNITSPVRIIYDRLSEEVPSEAVGGSGQ